MGRACALPGRPTGARPRSVPSGPTRQALTLPPPIASPVPWSELDQSPWAWPRHSQPTPQGERVRSLAQPWNSACTCPCCVYPRPPSSLGCPQTPRPPGAKAGRAVSPCPVGQAPGGRPLQALGGLLSAPSTRPSRWLTAGPTGTVPRGRRGRTATVSGPALRGLPGLGGSGPGDPGWCASLLLVSRPPPTPAQAPRRFEGLGFVPCFQGIKTGQCVVFNGTHRTCEIRGWCPVESGTAPV